jgi:hypothetical protein
MILALALSLPSMESALDSTPGGGNDAYLLEDNVSGYRLEDDTGDYLMESAT